MLCKNKLGVGLTTSDNLCCNIEYNQEQQIVGLRKNILPKSTQKNQKTQKTSLKKRSGSNKSQKQVKKQIFALQTKQCTPPKSCSNLPQNIRQTQSSLLFQRIKINSMPPTVNCIKYTYEKPLKLQKKINFVYNSKVTPGKCDNLGVNDLESFKQQVKFINVYKAQNKAFNLNMTHRQSSLHFCSPMDPHKSTQNTQRASQRIDTWDQSPCLSFYFRNDQTVPVGNNNNTQDKKLLLSSRKNTVLSVNGDSESNQSFAVQDLQPLSFFQYNSIKSSTLIDQIQKIKYRQIKSRMNL